MYHRLCRGIDWGRTETTFSPVFLSSNLNSEVIWKHFVRYKIINSAFLYSPLSHPFLFLCLPTTPTILSSACRECMILGTRMSWTCTSDFSVSLYHGFNNCLLILKRQKHLLKKIQQMKFDFLISYSFCAERMDWLKWLKVDVFFSKTSDMWITVRHYFWLSE